MCENKTRCVVCDGTEFYKDSGFFYCKECHTQAKGLIETEFDINVTLTGPLRTITVKKKKRVEEERGKAVDWTSWEGHNFVLKGLVDELIALGARPGLKILVLQLWSKYLNKLEVAFTSTTELELPKFGLNQHEKDFQVIYGTKKKKKPNVYKKKKVVSESVEVDLNATDVEKRRVFMRMRKAVVLAEYERVREELASTQDVMSQVDERLKRTAEAQLPTVEVQYSKEALRVSRLRRNAKRKRSPDEDEEDEDVEIDSRSLTVDNPHRLTRLKLIGILCLALILSKEEIQISDVVRWIFEGHLSYFRVAHLFPPHIRFSRGDLPFLSPVTAVPSHKSILLTVSSLSRLLQVECFPAPDMLALVGRFVRELRLPSHLAVYAERFMASARGQLAHSSEELMNYEGLAMAYVIVLLKMMFGLDGTTEHRISSFVKDINRCCPEDDYVDALFDWDEWVAYIECRRSVVVAEHFPTKYKRGTNVATSVEPYVRYIHDCAGKEAKVEKMFSGHSNWLRTSSDLSESMKRSVSQLPAAEAANSTSLNFPPSLTPLASYLDIILGSPQRQASLPVKLLRKDFPRKSLEFLVDPRRLVSHARTKGLNIDVRNTRAVEVSEFIPRVSCGRIEKYGTEHNRPVVIRFPGDKPEDPPPTSSQDGTRVASDNILSRSKRRKSKLFHATELTGDENKLRTRLTFPYPTDIESGPELSSGRNSVACDKTLVLYVPYKSYWLFKCCGIQVGRYEEFTNKIEPRLPDSFRWLLSECSQMLGMKTKDLYAQVMAVESLYFSEKKPLSINLFP